MSLHTLTYKLKLSTVFDNFELRHSRQSQVFHYTDGTRYVLAEEIRRSITKHVKQ